MEQVGSTIAVARPIVVEVPVAEPLGQGGADGLARLDEALAALRGDRDQLGAPVLGVGAPGDQAEPVRGWPADG